MVNPILQRAAERYSASRSAYVDVAEWGEEPGKPLRIWFLRASFRDKNAMYKKHAANNLEYLVDAIIAKARVSDDADAKLMFSEEDRFTLMNHVDPEVIIRVGNEILKGVNDESNSVRDATKNSKAIPS